MRAKILMVCFLAGIISDGQAGSSVGFLQFSLSDRTTVDIFTRDLNVSLDPEIYLFQGSQANLQNGSLTPLLATDDDSCPNSFCGPSGFFHNSLISQIALQPGVYTIAASDFSFLESEARVGENVGVESGLLQVVVEEDGTVLFSGDFTIMEGSLLQLLQFAQQEQEQRVVQQSAMEQNAASATVSFATINSANSIVTNRQVNLRNDTTTAGVDFKLLGFENNQDATRLVNGIQQWLSGTYGGAAGDDSSAILDDRLGIFVTGNYSFGDHDRTRREAGFGFDILGATVGSDYRLTDDLFVGVAFGYSSTDTTFDRSGGDLGADTYHIDLYSTYQFNDFYLDGIFRYGWSYFDLNRNFTIAGTRETATADFEGIDYSAGVSGGYVFSYDALTIEPFVRLEYTAVDIDSYREKADSANSTASLLDVNQQNLQSLRSTLGTQMNYVFSTSYGVLIPSIRAEWVHEYKNNERTITSRRFNTSSAPVSVQSELPDRDYFNLGAGLTGVFAHGVSGFFSYEALVGNNFLSQHTVTAGVRLEF